MLGSIILLLFILACTRSNFLLMPGINVLGIRCKLLCSKTRRTFTNVHDTVAGAARTLQKTRTHSSGMHVLIRVHVRRTVFWDAYVSSMPHTTNSTYVQQYSRNASWRFVEKRSGQCGGLYLRTYLQQSIRYRIPVPRATRTAAVLASR